MIQGLQVEGLGCCRFQPLGEGPTSLSWVVSECFGIHIGQPDFANKSTRYVLPRSPILGMNIAAVSTKILLGPTP